MRKRELLGTLMFLSVGLLVIIGVSLDPAEDLTLGTLLAALGSIAAGLGWIALVRADLRKTKTPALCSPDPSVRRRWPLHRYFDTGEMHEQRHILQCKVCGARRGADPEVPIIYW